MCYSKGLEPKRVATGMQALQLSREELKQKPKEAMAQGLGFLGLSLGSSGTLSWGL